MANNKINILSSKDFTHQFMVDTPLYLQSVKNPIQVYDIEGSVHYIKTPTPLHRPNYNFIVHVTNGKAIEQVGAEIVTVASGDVLFIREGMIMGIKEFSKDIEGHFILFENEALNHILTKQELTQLFSVHHHIHLTSETSTWLTSLFELMDNDFKSESTNIQIAYSLLKAGLQKIITGEPGISSPLHRADEINYQFKELLYQSFLTERTVSFYSSKLNISDNYLTRCLKTTTGQSPKEWINKVAILHSQLLLQDFTKDIAQIAYELNFEDPSYFGRLFKKTTGQTPSEYRESLLRNF